MALLISILKFRNCGLHKHTHTTEQKNSVKIIRQSASFKEFSSYRLSIVARNKGQTLKIRQCQCYWGGERGVGLLGFVYFVVLGFFPFKRTSCWKILSSVCATLPLPLFLTVSCLSLFKSNYLPKQHGASTEFNFCWKQSTGNFTGTLSDVSPSLFGSCHQCLNWKWSTLTCASGGLKSYCTHRELLWEEPAPQPPWQTCLRPLTDALIFSIFILQMLYCTSV